MAMAIYGYFNMESEWQLNSWTISKHILLLSVGFIGMLASGWMLQKFTNSKMPFEDSFTSIFSVVATWVMVNYINENYLYWIIIDAVSVHLYWKREMYYGSLLYVLYTAMVTAGYFGWI
jgi:nicotinamide mononucleotide transporter